jgi:hypothetical protein
VGLWWYIVWYLGGALPDGATITFLFFTSLWARIASSAMMTLLTNSGNDPPVLSAMCSCSMVERPIMKQYIFLSSKQVTISSKIKTKQYSELKVR